MQSFAYTANPSRMVFGPGTLAQLGAEAQRPGADCAVAIGGGSTTGLGKAIALESGLPVIAVPTTYPNPRPLERAALRALLQRAFDGLAPAA